MNILVELGGIARIVTGERQIALTLPEETTFREIVRLLGARYPALVGQVIHPDGDSLYASHMLSLNGKLMVRPEQLDESPRDGDRLIVMSILAGG